MNWIKELCDLYDKNKHLAGKIKIGRYQEPLILLPIFHTTVKAQITAAINEEGEFVGAEEVSEEDSITIIPVTEKSASRTASPVPHPLCDNLKYIAGDYMKYVILNKGKDTSHIYQMYMKQLEKWVKSPFAHPKAIAIWKYLTKESLMKDLIFTGILKADEEGYVRNDIKIQKIPQPDVFVRFRVESDWDSWESIMDAGRKEESSPCWLDCSLHDKYIGYCRSVKKQQGLSYLTGEVTEIAYLHPKKIRNEGDAAKLISANDKDYFTFRGHFADKEEAFAIGYEDSQKAHNALKWIIRKQGRTWNGLTVVTWEPDLKELPDWGMDTDTVCDAYEASDWFDIEEETEDTYMGTNEADAARFQNAISGYGKKLNYNSNIILMAFDAATTGRLAVMECQSLKTSIYLENLRHWYQDCGWLHPKFKNKTYHQYYGMAGIRDIANILYGVESKEGLSIKGANDKMYAEVCKRLIPCIIFRRPIPKDMVRLAMQRASSPVTYEKSYNWERTLALACSFIKKREIEKSKHKTDKEVWTMSLNKESHDRNYLYGRLLALADRIEYRTFEKGEDRETNGKRFMNAFSQQPFRTWKVIEERIQPYYMKLVVHERKHYRDLMDEIIWLFEEGEFEKNDALNGLYLLGFHNQSYDLKNKKED